MNGAGGGDVKVGKASFYGSRENNRAVLGEADNRPFHENWLAWQWGEANHWEGIRAELRYYEKVVNDNMLKNIQRGYDTNRTSMRRK
jgi:hypothetical protein